MITGTVKGQSLRISSPTIAAATISYLTARFVFTSDWDGAVKFAHFSCGDKNYSVPLTDDEIGEGDKLNLGAGTWKVWLHGERYEGGELTQRITTEEALLVVRATGSFEGEPFPTTPSEIERLHAEFDKVKRGVQSDWGQNDESAADFVRNRPGGYIALEPTITGEYTGEELNMGEFTLVVGKEYIVRIDGTEYKNTARRERTGYTEYSYILGNSEYYDYPFYLRIIETNYSGGESQTGNLIAKLSPTITTATITIIENIVHQIPEIYIPEIPVEKIIPNPIQELEFIKTLQLREGKTQSVYLGDIKTHRIIVGYGMARTKTKPSQIAINYIKEPTDGGDLRYSTYNQLAFIGFKYMNGNYASYYLLIFRAREIGGSGTKSEYYSQNIFTIGNASLIYLESLTNSNLEATTFYIYGMN